MEKPFVLFNLGRGVNHIRYHYFYGKLYPIYANMQKISLITLVFMLIDWGPDHILGISLPIYLIIMFSMGFVFSFGMLSLFYTTDLKDNIISSGIVGGYNFILATGIFYLLHSYQHGTTEQGLLINTTNLILGIIFILLATGIYIYLYFNTGRITIYPNRIECDGNIFMLDRVKKVMYNTGELETHTPQEFQGKDLRILTPLHFIDEYEDCDILHHYVFLEYDDTNVYVMQPLTYRNHFAGNARNAWLEDWRWDGKRKTPPEGWEKGDHLN